MSDQSLTRFAPLFRPEAPNPHQQLATLSYSIGSETYVARLIEGESNDVVNSVCAISDFGAGTRISVLALQALLAQLRLLFPPFCPCSRSETLEFDVDGDAVFHPTGVKVRFMPGYGPDGTTPDTAVVEVRTKEGLTVPIYFHEIRPGLGFLAIVAVGVLLFASGCSISRVTGRIKHTDKDGVTNEAEIGVDINSAPSKQGDKVKKPVTPKLEEKK